MISNVIPVFNESANIATLYERTVKEIDKIKILFEIIFINDGSKDNTETKIKEIVEKDSRIKLITFSRNFGQTAAMQAGIDYAKGDVIVPMDGDLQNDPQDIQKLLAKLNEGYDVVSGWRKNRADNALIRNFPSKVANKIISIISGVHLHDYGCTLKAYKKWTIKQISLYGEMHRFIPIYAYWMGGRVTEIPVIHHSRIHGKSKYGLNRAFKVILDLLVIQFLFHYSVKPIYIFGGFGFFSLLIGFISGSYAIYLKLAEGLHFIRTPLPLLTVMCLITGVMCILMGLLAEMIVRIYYESQKKSVYFIKETVNLEQKDQ